MTYIDSIDFHYDNTDSVGMSENEANEWISTYNMFFIIYCAEIWLLKWQKICKWKKIEDFLEGYIGDDWIIETYRFYTDNYDGKIWEDDFNEEWLELVKYFYIWEESEDDEDAIDYISVYNYTFMKEEEYDDLKKFYSVKPTKSNYLNLKKNLDEIFNFCE